jgi:hypothetical protein
LAQFRTTADIVDLALVNGGEVTNGNSPYESQVLSYLNRVHFAIVAGGTIPVGRDTTVKIDENWPWARSPRPIILELQPKIETGTVSLTQGSEAGTFSSAPSASVAGWYLRVSGRSDVIRIASHTAAATAFELDGAYPDETGASLNYEVFKLDYALTPEYIVIDETNNKINFKTTAGGAELTTTLTAGAYTPSALATHVGSSMTTTAAGPTISCTYSAVTKLFTLSSNGAGSTTLLPLFATGANQKQSAHKALGFDDTDSSAATTHIGVYILGGIARLIEPIKINKNGGSIFAVDAETFQRDLPLVDTVEGVPMRFCVAQEKDDGSFVLRFDRYPEEKTRIEIDYVPIPRDLKDNAGSIPLVPRKHCDVLEDAATFYLLLNKNDDRAQIYASLLQGKLEAMVAQHRGSLQRAGENFGQIVPRADKTVRRRKIFNSEPY